MQALAVSRFPLCAPFTCRTWRKWDCRHGARSFASSSPSRLPPSVEVHDDQSRGGLPRFYCPDLPSSKGNIVRVKDDEFWHMAKVLRLGLNDRVELFNGQGGLIKGYLKKIDRTGLDFVALEDIRVISPRSVKWHVFAAFGSLKGGRADWLVEKCTELDAFSVTPLLTTRSPTLAENRLVRLQRVSLAATKQCQRLHRMILNPPLKLFDLLPKIAESKNTFLAEAGATSLFTSLNSSGIDGGGLLLVGPEGDFTEEEVEMLTNAGATSVGLGPCRLRVETAAIALLSALMLYSDSQISSRCSSAI